MLKCKDIMLHIKQVFKMNNVYDCARPFLLFFGLFGIGGSKICAIEGVRNTRFSFLITTVLNLLIMPTYFVISVKMLFTSKPAILLIMVSRIIQFGIYVFFYIYYWYGIYSDSPFLQEYMMLKQENIIVHYWKIAFEIILFGLLSVQYSEIYIVVDIMSTEHRFIGILFYLVKLFIDITRHVFFMWVILFILIIRERFTCLNKLLLQNAQVSTIQIIENRNLQDNTLLRRLSTARDIHEKLSEVIVQFSDISRFVIVGSLVVPILHTLLRTLTAAKLQEIRWIYIFGVLSPVSKLVIFTGICQSHKNNRRVLTATLRNFIAYAEDRRIIQQLKRYIMFNHTTVAGLLDFQLIEIDHTLLFTIIDVIASNMLVIYSNLRS